MRGLHLIFVFLLSCVTVGIVLGETQERENNYNHYTKNLNKADGLVQGLRSSPNGWTLNKRPIKILSGSIHYFRIHPDYWRDRLRKLRAAGANTVDTTIPWNLHMLERGHTDFGRGYSVLGKKATSTMTRFLDVVKFLEIAREEDLFVIIRVGPYVGADLDLGGIPGWLLLLDNVRPRSEEKEFMTKLQNYYGELLPLLQPFGFSRSEAPAKGHSRRNSRAGGHIIAYQIDHELGSTSDSPHAEYLDAMIQNLRNADIQEMIFLADLPTSNGAKIVETIVARTASRNDRRVLRTACFGWNVNFEMQLEWLNKTQPNTQLMVSEFRTGRFDRWMQRHRSLPEETYAANLERVLEYPASVNVYMFSGGTNWGFISGASLLDTYPYFQSVVTSYDNDAPVDEAGELTGNYYNVKDLFYRNSVTKIPWLIEQARSIVNKTYSPVEVTSQLDLDGIVSQCGNWWKRVARVDPTNMENVARTMDEKQLFGFVLYRKKDVEFAASSVLQIKGRVHDVATVIVDGKTVTEPLTKPEQLNGFGYWNAKDATLAIRSDAPGKRTLEILVENLGRVNLQKSNSVFSSQKKGIYEGPIMVDGNALQGWDIIPVDLIDENWINSLTGWKERVEHKAPTMYKATFKLGDKHDTFLDMREWGRGVVFINGFNLGRYHSMGPTRTLYLPAPFLVSGENTIVVFEIDKQSDKIKFAERHIRTAAPFAPGDEKSPDSKTLNKLAANAAPSSSLCRAGLVTCVLASAWSSLF